MEYSELNNLIDALQQAVRNEHPEKGYWKELWSLVRETRASFKETRYPTAEEKQAAWSRVNQLAEEAERRSQREKEERERRERAWKERQDRSGRALNRIESKLAGTRPLSDLEHMIGTLILGPILVVESMLRSVLGLEELDAVHEDLKACSSYMKDAWRLFNDHKRELLPGDKSRAYQELTAAQERLNNAWDRWKAAKDEFHQRRRQEWEQRRHNREERHRDFVRRVEANIEKLEAKLAKAEDALGRQQNHLSDLRDQYASAWSDSFRDRCSDWIDEAENRIRDIEDSIDRMRGWIDEERSKLR